MRPREAIARGGYRRLVGRGVLPLACHLRLWRRIGYDGHPSAEIFREEYRARPVEQVVRGTRESLDRRLAADGI